VTRGEAKKIYEARAQRGREAYDAEEVCGHECPSGGYHCMKHPDHLGLHRCTLRELGHDYDGGAEWTSEHDHAERMAAEARGLY